MGDLVCLCLSLYGYVFIGDPAIQALESDQGDAVLEMEIGYGCMFQPPCSSCKSLSQEHTQLC